MSEIKPDIPGTEGSQTAPNQQLSSAIGYFVIGESPIGGPGPTSGTAGIANIIPSYVYWQYSDDDNIQALVSAWNQMAQAYLNWFNSIGLPIYTGLSIYGALLDWVAQGLYGLSRPTIPSGTTQTLGTLGTLGIGDGVPLGVLDIVGPSAYYATDDDIFKRILTWHLYKGDGKVFSIQWLKRRIMRFLIGSSGATPNVDQTYRISVTFGTGNQVNITIVNQVGNIIGGAIPGMLSLGDGAPLGTLIATTQFLPAMPFAQQLKDAIDYGVLELPFQYTYVVQI